MTEEEKIQVIQQAAKDTLFFLKKYAKDVNLTPMDMINVASLMAYTINEEAQYQMLKKKYETQAQEPVLNISDEDFNKMIFEN